MSRGRGTPEWSVSGNCVLLFAWLSRIGSVLSLASVASVFYILIKHLRKPARDNSIVLPISAILSVLFVMYFALAYPFDDNAVLNPRYLMPAIVPMLACMGLTLARFEHPPRRLGLIHALAFAAIIITGALLVVERVGG